MQSRTLTGRDGCPFVEQRYEFRNTAQVEYLTAPKGALQGYQQKPDCFQDAINLVKARCEESRMDEPERIQGTLVHFQVTFVLSNRAYKLPLV